jgi:hypothetical protein
LFAKAGLLPVYWNLYRPNKPNKAQTIGAHGVDGSGLLDISALVHARTAI